MKLHEKAARRSSVQISLTASHRPPRIHIVFNELPETESLGVDPADPRYDFVRGDISDPGAVSDVRNTRLDVW